ncbi:unnamed protein product, partial [Vitis vinifera]|uniref:Uncharacterized protein n=1 Tax=Vitis vinifera TaxID=29760 RepID=D7THP7_VITVI
MVWLHILVLPTHELSYLPLHLQDAKLNANNILPTHKLLDNRGIANTFLKFFHENASMSPSDRERTCTTGTNCGFASSSVEHVSTAMGVTSQFPTFVEAALLKPTLASLINSFSDARNSWVGTEDIAEAKDMRVSSNSSSSSSDDAKSRGTAEEILSKDSKKWSSSSSSSKPYQLTEKREWNSGREKNKGGFGAYVSVLVSFGWLGLRRIETVNGASPHVSRLYTHHPQLDSFHIRRCASLVLLSSGSFVNSV